MARFRPFELKIPPRGFTGTPSSTHVVPDPFFRAILMMFFGGSRKVWGNKWVGDNYSAPRVSFPGGLPALLPDLLDPLDPGPPAQGDNQETTTISPSARPSVPLARPGPGKGEGDCCLLLYCPPIGTPLVGGRGWSLTPPKKMPLLISTRPVGVHS